MYNEWKGKNLIKLNFLDVVVNRNIITSISKKTKNKKKTNKKNPTYVY